MFTLARSSLVFAGMKAYIVIRCPKHDSIVAKHVLVTKRASTYATGWDYVLDMRSRGAIDKVCKHRVNLACSASFVYVEEPTRVAG